MMFGSSECINHEGPHCTTRPTSSYTVHIITLCHMVHIITFLGSFQNNAIHISMPFFSPHRILRDRGKCRTQRKSYHSTERRYCSGRRCVGKLQPQQIRERLACDRHTQEPSLSDPWYVAVVINK